MQVLIDNYTTNEPSTLSNPNVARIWYKTDVQPLSSSITITLKHQIGLNNRIHKLLREFSVLEDNWDENDSIAPIESVIKQAKFITSLLEKHGQPIFHAAPGPNGEIMLDIRNKKKDRSLEIIFYPLKSVVVLFPERGTPDQQIFTINNLPYLLEWLNQK
ncbi:hypothetical protein [Cytophaga aurantiaca]|uniref:hypothetical protein n=1 Tax=Cytophaga aurantiaca TaxID=29530 RepID=UPI000524C168|nr:hypothetical protein [Cytophaga aurantiaca]